MTGKRNRTLDPPEAAPTFWLAVLIASRKSRDAMLERIARERLGEMNVRVIWATELPTSEGNRDE